MAKHEKMLASIALLFAVLVFEGASAAFEITAFSCNGQGGSVVVENGAAMNCMARIANTDQQNSASVGTVTLAVSGGWAESASYAVALSKSIAAGGTEDVTFQNIRSITPGDSHAFSYVDIDGTSHTEQVASYFVNAIAIKSLTATPSASSVATGVLFDVDSTVRAGGSFGSMVLDISLSGGCSLDSGQSASKSLGAMSNNAQASTSWKVVQGSAHCTATVRATGTSSSISTSDTKQATVTNPDYTGETTTTSGAAGAGGGGGGGGGSGTSTKVHEVGELGLSVVTKQLSLGDSMRFRLSGVNHTIAVRNMTRTNATLEIASSPITATLRVGEKRNFDIDSDGKLDIAVTLNKITYDWNAEITLALINEELIQKIRSAPPTATPVTSGTPSSSETPAGRPSTTPTFAAGVPGPKSGNLFVVMAVFAAIIVLAIAVFVVKKRGGKSVEKSPDEAVSDFKATVKEEDKNNENGGQNP